MLSKNKKLYFYIFLSLFLVFQCIVAVKHSWDLECYLRASERILNDSPLYIQESIPYVYPPFFAFVLIPVSYINTTITKILWFLSSLFFLYYAVFLLIKNTLPENKKDDKYYLYFFPLAFTLRFIMDNFALGQVNILIMFILVLTLYFFLTGKDFYAGLFLGLAISIKLTSIVILFYFIYRRKFHITIYSVISIVFFLLIPSIAFGIKKNIQYLYEYSFIIKNFSDSTINNQSLFITVKRLLSPIPPWDNLYVNFAELNEFQINLITIFIFSIITIFLSYLFRSKPKNRRNSNIYYEYSLVIICMLFFSPLSRKAHFVLLLIPHIFLFYYVLKNNPGAGLIKYLLILSLIFNSLMSELPVQILAFFYNLITSGNLNGSDLSDVFESYSCVTIGTALLFAGLCTAIYYNNKEESI